MIIINCSKHAEIHADILPSMVSPPPSPLQFIPDIEQHENKIHIFTQFFVHKKENRNTELKECLKRNCDNPHIHQVHLLNERIYTNKELGFIESNQKIKQIVIGKRLTFKDIFKYARTNNIQGYLVFTNADIFFNETIENLQYSALSIKKQMFALLRYEYRGESDLNTCKIFGPRFDSQDTWIFHSSMFLKNYIKEIHENAMNVEFGKPGCDNKFAYLMNVLGYEIINDCGFLKTFHYHTDVQRDYTNKDQVQPPYAVVCPAGMNFLQLQPCLGIDPMNTIRHTMGFSRISFDENNLLYEYIKNKLDNNKPFIIPRISGVENNYAFFGKMAQENGGNLQPNMQNYISQTINIMKRNAGIRISNNESLMKYSSLYLKAFENCEMFGGWESWGHYINHIQQSHDFMFQIYSKKHAFWAYTLDIFHYIYNRPFTQAMAGKRLLIVSCFEESIRTKLSIREKIYDGVDLFPNCEFVFIRPPITNGDNPSNEFDEELEKFYKKLDMLRNEYDVALLSCGGYANIIANYIFENHHKSSIYIGGVLQMYFGIYGGRWLNERKDILNIYMNQYWSRPTKKETDLVSGFKNIEKGCYW